MQKRFQLFGFLISAGLINVLSAQQPYIVSTQGLGQYGYLEVNAATYARLNSNTFNARELAARWWTGAEYIYYAGDIGSCIPQESSTSDYSSGNHPNWNAGTIAYVSVRFKQCDFNWNTTDYNERSFQLIDVDNTYTGSFDDNVTDNPSGTQNLVGSFTINTGGSILTLDRLWVTNTGTAQEGMDIPNDGVRVYYEAITGSETYDGDESFRTLYGDYGGNNTSNEEWGNDDLNLPIGAAGVRCYLVVSDLAPTFTSGNTVFFQTQNDGLSFQELRDGSYNKLRINVMNTAAGSVPLPVQLTGFRGALVGGAVKLSWETVQERNNDHFEIERSSPDEQWAMLDLVESAGANSNERQAYDFTDKHPFEGLNYYRLKQMDLDGASSYSPIVTVVNDVEKAIVIASTIIRGDQLQVLLPNSEGPCTLSIFDAFGRQLRNWTVETTKGEPIDLEVESLPTGLLWLRLNGKTSIKLLKLD